MTYDKTKHQVKYAAKADTLKNRIKYDGETYELVINVKVNELANQNSVAKNQGTSIINKVEKDTNIITVYFPKIPVKEVQQNGKDVNGRNDGKKGTPTAPLNAGSEVQYLVIQKWHTKGVDAASDHYKQFSIQDPIEDRLTYKEGSAQVIDKSTGKDITSEGTLTYDSNSRTLKWEASADFLNNNYDYFLPDIYARRLYHNMHDQIVEEAKENIFIKIVQSLDNSTAQKLLIQFYEEKQIDRLQEYLEKLCQNEEITEVIRKRLLLEAEKAVKE